MESYVEISPVVLELYQEKQEKRTEWQTSRILQTWSIVFVSLLLNEQIDRKKCIVISHLKSTAAYRNKFFSNYDNDH